MLANKIVEAVGCPVDNERTGFMMTRFAEKVIDAERFYITSDVMRSCWKLAQSKPSSILDATQFCRAPFKKTWLEWDGSNYGRGNPINDGSGKVEAAPVRFGALLEALDDTYRRIGVSYAWQHEKSLVPKLAGTPVNACPLGFVINWEDSWSPTLAPLADQPRLETKGRFKEYAKDPKQFDAMKQLTSMTQYTIVPHCQEFIARLRSENGDSAYNNMIDVWRGDLEGEGSLLVAVLCLLNAKNCVSQTPVDVRKSNKLRRLRGKKPLLSYSEVNINLSRRDAEYAERMDMTKAEIRQHIVRGHFKVRKSGIYWWRPFIRGDAAHGEVRRSGYKFTDSQAA